MARTVWVVMTGEKYEGGGIEAIFDQEPTDQQVFDLCGDSWEPCWPSRSGKDRMWHWRSDWLKVFEMEVRESC